MAEILLAESERDLSISIKRYLDLFNVNVDVVNDGAQTINEFSNKKYDVVIIDDNLSRIKATDVIRMIKKQNCNIKIILLSNKSIDKKIDDCDDVVIYPFTPCELRESLCKVGSYLWLRKLKESLF